MTYRIVLATLNARYIHASLGLRCLLANMARYGSAELRAATLLREYTISRACCRGCCRRWTNRGPHAVAGPSASSVMAAPYPAPMAAIDMG